MDKKTSSTIVSFVVLALVLAGYFNIRPVGPYVRKLFFDAKDTVVRGSSSGGGGGAVGNTALAQACRANLQMIESAKAKFRTTRAIGNISWGEIYKELGVRQLSCPAGGEYVLGSQQVSARCTIGDNNTPSSADDHVVR